MAPRKHLRDLYRAITGLGLLVLIAFALSCCAKDKEKGEFDEAIENCVRWMACFEDPSEQMILTRCVESNRWFKESNRWRTDSGYLHQFTLFNCELDAESCEEMFKCGGSEASDDQKALCVGREGEKFCDGTSILNCSDGPNSLTMTWDCAPFDMQCIETPTVDCSRQDCIPNTDVPWCDGTKYTYCDDSGTWRTYDCNYHFMPNESVPFGSDTFAIGSGTCGEDRNGLLACTGDGEPCDQFEFENFCDGDHAYVCREDRISHLDCRTLGPHETCGLRGSRNIDCIWDDNECTWDSQNEECDDGVITYCLEGGWATLDCKDYGFDGCALVDQYNFQSAYCTGDGGF